MGQGNCPFHGLGTEYLLRNVAYIALCLVTIRVRNETFHRVFVIAAIAYEILWIIRLYSRLD